ncbi:hypothetical protein NEUTE1DRAFT_109516 [Neurospora tetrasperma FGSC 2508]|uniref:Uncharacterized protein n=1 Tax=Neurospora tetrasperma (strain FGSC 2508 / ATCC MYA-4615 / P0657) TaxID=510951 RepID=F8MN62_NEUT8|nr:uncharacterized protein NEUTE1DRAFT_109516 [Neurospora tetrasperma FGSC 2508]EGO57235.1 hypothetical protein NEUTE1DRAFT_109516 [Neurospora tetrasperma FGSC 2508]EGZ72518.1 hypothetical protein NEUTE2DRAFT_139498 [Neurospora tetrasperma FGSC 2509]
MSWYGFQCSPLHGPLPSPHLVFGPSGCHAPTSQVPETRTKKSHGRLALPGPTSFNRGLGMKRGRPLRCRWKLQTTWQEEQPREAGSGATDPIPTSHHTFMTNIAFIFSSTMSECVTVNTLVAALAHKVFLANIWLLVFSVNILSSRPPGVHRIPLRTSTIDTESFRATSTEEGTIGIIKGKNTIGAFRLASPLEVMSQRTTDKTKQQLLPLPQTARFSSPVGAPRKL